MENRVSDVVSRVRDSLSVYSSAVRFLSAEKYGGVLGTVKHLKGKKGDHDQASHGERSAGGHGSRLSRGVDYIDNPHGRDVPMVRNPSRSEAHKMFENAIAGLRGVVVDGNIWLVDAMKTWHKDMVDAIGADYAETNSNNGLKFFKGKGHLDIVYDRLENDGGLVAKSLTIYLNERKHMPGGQSHDQSKDRH